MILEKDSNMLYNIVRIFFMEVIIWKKLEDLK
jgi:hypothetical protein